MTKNELVSLVSTSLSQKRAAHTFAVAKLSVELAKHYGVSEDDAYLAAMLHDITKELSIGEQLQTIRSSDIINHVILEGCENVLHSQTAFLKARDYYEIENQEVLNSIRYHTTGRAGMSMLEKIIFIADTVSYDRIYDDAKRLRNLAFVNLNETMIFIIEFIVKKLVSEQKIIFLSTIECYNSCISSKLKEKNNEIKK